MKKRDYIMCILVGGGVFFAQVFRAAAANFGGVTQRTSALLMHAFDEIIRSPTGLLWIAWYVCLGVVTHCAPLAVTVKFVTDLRLRGPVQIRSFLAQRGVVLLTILLMTTALIQWNTWMFPDTLRVEGASLLASHNAVLLIVSTVSVAALAVSWLLTAATTKAIAILLSPLALLLTATALTSPSTPTGIERVQPDIIILGVDSLRPDHLHGRGGSNTISPNIDNFIRHSVSFEQAYTPMGRTFVALMSILSGQYPIGHGARENLYPREMLDIEQVLPHVLRTHGYRTIFSLDEVRFANIDEHFGFDILAGPPAGVVELTSTALANTAGTNFAQLIPGLSVLFPHTSGNRALHDAYVADIQTERIARATRRVSPQDPMLLVAHFTMPHTPFARGKWHKEILDPDYTDSPPGYRKAVSVADLQIQSLLETLRRQGRLDNALVFLLSDHGEGLGMEKDSWTSARLASNPSRVPARFGHGTAALDDAQSRIVLAAQLYENGSPVWPARRSSSPASLIDIAPTALHIAGLGHHGLQFDGAPLINRDGNVIAPRSRGIFVESGIFGQSLETLDVDPGSVANEFSHLYNVTTDLRVELKREYLPDLLEAKERGVILNGFGVAAVPSPLGTGCWVKVDYSSRERQCFSEPHSDPLVAKYSALVCSHFAQDSSFYQSWCTS